MKRSITLLVFAHRGEGKAFLRSYFFKGLKRYHFLNKLFLSESSLPQQEVAECYKSASYYVLLTGEGINKALFAMSAFLASLSDEERNQLVVYNLGVAGLLRDDTQKNFNPQPGDIYAVRTIYGYGYAKPFFQSFTLQSAGLSSIDCISCEKRMVSEDDRQALRIDYQLATEKQEMGNFAPLVDRELWGIAYATHQYGIPIYAYKMGYDIVGKNQMLIENLIDTLSERLLQHYQQLKINGIDKQTARINGKHGDDNDFATILNFFVEKGFHFTHTQEKIFSRLCKTMVLSANNKCYQELLVWCSAWNDKINQILGSKKKSFTTNTSGKHKTKMLLQALEGEVNPLVKEATTLLQDVAKPWEQQGVEVRWHHRLDSNKIKMSFHFSNADEFEQKKNLLGKFPADKIERILSGKW